MKKFLKFLLGVGAVVAAIGAALYFLKKVLMKDYLEDYDDDDFDNDIYEEDDVEERDYVTINVPGKETEDTTQKTEADDFDFTSMDDDDEVSAEMEETTKGDFETFDSVSD
nr:hypothetical protein [Eubacterium sp.]